MNLVKSLSIENGKEYKPLQLFTLVLLRVLIGWHFFYEGIAKLMNPDWTSSAYLLDSKGMFSEIFYWMANSKTVLEVVDFMNIWGLIGIGLGLILGFMTRIATVAGIFLLIFYFLSHPPIPGLFYIMPDEGSYLLVNKTLIEIFALLVLFVFPSGNRIGIDSFFGKQSR